MTMSYGQKQSIKVLIYTQNYNLFVNNSLQHTCTNIINSKIGKSERKDEVTKNMEIIYNDNTTHKGIYLQNYNNYKIKKHNK